VNSTQLAACILSVLVGMEFVTGSGLDLMRSFSLNGRPATPGPPRGVVVRRRTTGVGSVCGDFRIPPARAIHRRLQRQHDVSQLIQLTGHEGLGL